MITILGMDGNPPTGRDVDGSRNNFVFGYFLLKPSGNYASGGDGLDLTAITSLIPGATLVNAKAKGMGAFTGLSGSGGDYRVIGDPLTPTALNAYKLAMFTSGSTELGAGAYGAAETGDVIVLETMWRKLA